MEAQDIDTPTLSVIKDEILDSLGRSGPMCRSQLALELFLGIKAINPAIHELELSGLIERRTDIEECTEYSEDETPFSLKRAFDVKMILANREFFKR